MEEKLSRFREETESEKEVRRRKIIEHNLASLNSREANEVIHNESMGGNAGAENYEDETATFVGLNFYAEPKTGKISMFGNVQNLSPDLIKGKLHGIIKLGFFMPSTTNLRLDKISDTSLYIFDIHDDISSFTEEVEKIMEETKGCYNIDKVKTWISLEHALKALDTIKSSNNESFGYEQMWQMINAVRSQNLDIRVITNTYGLRAKVLELIKKEKIK